MKEGEEEEMRKGGKEREKEGGKKFEVGHDESTPLQTKALPAG